MDSRSRRFSASISNIQPRMRVCEPGKVDLWHIELDRVPVALQQHLSSSDFREAGRIGTECERRTFLRIRSTLRSVLAPYVGSNPDDLEFSSEPGGICLTAPASLLRFHLSHSENLLLVAVTFARQVGVDVEFMRADLPFETLADFYFDPRDAWRLRHLAHSDRMRHFYQEWTSSEARRCVAGDCRTSASRWCVLNFTPAEGFSAALAVEGEDFCLDWHRWL
jgi:4'-phosphopantetheinyl transferase